MAGFNATESLSFFREDSGQEYGAVMFDAKRSPQAKPDWFSPEHWGEQARPVDNGGRGAAWFVDGPFGHAVLRHYLRGGWIARLTRDRHLWRGANKVRSFAEFRLLNELLQRKLSVPRPIAACYWRRGISYRAAILLERLVSVHSLADRVAVAGHDAPWEETGRLIARFHRVGLDHADLNAHNILFDAAGRSWLIDLDRSVLRLPATPWRERNLARLKRSLLKLRGTRNLADVQNDFIRLRHAYDTVWARGY